MPKMKTNRAAAKRLRRSKSGLVKRSKASHRHKAASKPTKRKRRLRKATLVSTADRRRVQGMLPKG